AKPSWAVFGTADRPVAPDLHRFQYERADSAVTEVEGASHFLMLSQPDIVAGVIREAVMASAVTPVAWNSRRPSVSKTILITGASSGFGRDTAETLHRAGHTVYASLRDARGKNRATAEALRELGIKTVELDVRDDASVEAGVKDVLAEAGEIDVLVNNAGIASAGVTEAFTAEEAKVVFDTNVIGLLRVTRAVLPSMRRRHDGLIINIGSVLGRVTFPFLGIYGASKFAVEALTDSLRYEVSQLGVEVVEVQPSAYPTNFFANIQTPLGIEVTESYGDVGHIPDAM